MRAQRNYRPGLEGALEDRVALTVMAPVSLRAATFSAQLPGHTVTTFPNPPRAPLGLGSFESVFRAPGASPSGPTGFGIAPTFHPGFGTGGTTNLGTVLTPTTGAGSTSSTLLNGSNVVTSGSGMGTGPLAGIGSTLGTTGVPNGMTGLSFLNGLGLGTSFTGTRSTGLGRGAFGNPMTATGLRF